MSYQENNLQYGKVLYPSPVIKEGCFSSPIVSSSNAEIVMQCEIVNLWESHLVFHEQNILQMK